jgi:hypothetical protein
MVSSQPTPVLANDCDAQCGQTQINLEYFGCEFQIVRHCEGTGWHYFIHNCGGGWEDAQLCCNRAGGCASGPQPEFNTCTPTNLCYYYP